MKGSNLTAKITLVVTVLVAVGIIVLLFFLPSLLDYFGEQWNFSQAQRNSIFTAYVLCALSSEWALFQMTRILRNIIAGQVFIRANVTAIRQLQICCLLICLICLPVSFHYFPLLIVALIMGFLALAVGVLCEAMKAAVAIREENDLTI